MEDNKISIKHDLDKYKSVYEKLIIINDIDINLNLFKYEDSTLPEIIQKWLTCFEILGKSNLFKTKSIIKILYCILTDCFTINTINEQKMDLDLYDAIIERFLRIEVVDIERTFKMKIFTVCNSMIVVDCRDMTKYKIYEVYNLQLLKQFYQTNKIDFDILVKDLNLEPIFIGNINNLCHDYKILSKNNYVIDKNQIINKLQKYTTHCKHLEFELQHKYNLFYKEAIKYFYIKY